jgi:two-component system, LytTR family, response regulator
MNVMIVDDEELARRLLREMLAAHADIEIVAECANGFEAVKAAAERRPDLIFLDVQMPKLDGFEVLELIGPGVGVIFVTAYDTYALRAFDVHAVDYLLKPFSRDRFEAALALAENRLGENTPPPAVLAATARAPGYLERIVVKDGARVHIIPVARLDFAEAQDDYICLTSNGKTYLKQQTIASLEESLDPRQFIRIHRSYIVNLDRVVKMEPYSKDSKVAVLSDGRQLPVSRAGYQRLAALLGEKL